MKGILQAGSEERAARPRLEDFEVKTPEDWQRFLRIRRKWLEYEKSVKK